MTVTFILSPTFQHTSHLSDEVTNRASMCSQWPNRAGHAGGPHGEGSVPREALLLLFPRLHRAKHPHPAAQ